MFTKESLDALRQRIDLVEVLSSHVRLQRAGAAYKALCPFHEEKTPSFVVQKGDSHYHCFGCGAHGDAIAFLMGHVKMGFTEAVEHLAERFQVVLEKTDEAFQDKGPSRAKLKAALEMACELYHYLLLHSEEGRSALQYLDKRGLKPDFLEKFQIGFAPKAPYVLMHYLKERGVSEEVLVTAGLMSISAAGKARDFFSDRITFPIRDALGAVIGFSARKFKEETFGGKYINTPETPLFKKSRVLFGLSYSRSRIAKEGKALVVEGQIDCLRLIDAGFDYVVAGQGTAFGEDHVRELLQLGAKQVYLALDADVAGKEAALKIGHLFQKKGVDVKVVALPEGLDPDALLTQRGVEAFTSCLKEAPDYLSFAYVHLTKGEKQLSAARKNEIVSTLSAKIREGEMPVMVHESLKKLAEIALVPPELLGATRLTSLPLKKRAFAGAQSFDPDRILEADCLRLLLLATSQYPSIVALARNNLSPEDLVFPAAVKLYTAFLSGETSGDMLVWGSVLETEEERSFLSDVMGRKVNFAKAEESFKHIVIKILERQWMRKREAIQQKLQTPGITDEESLELAQEFNALAKSPPRIKS